MTAVPGFVTITFNRNGARFDDVSLANHSNLEPEELASLLTQMAQYLRHEEYSTHHVHVN